MDQEPMLDPLRFPVVVIRRIEEQHPECAVGDGGAEKVYRKCAEEPPPRLLCALCVELDAEGLYGHRTRTAEPFGEPGERFPGPAARVQDADRLVAPVILGGHVDQPGDHVHYVRRRRIKSAFRLCGQSHVSSPFPC